MCVLVGCRIMHSPVAVEKSVARLSDTPVTFPYAGSSLPWPTDPLLLCPLVPVRHIRIMSRDSLDGFFESFGRSGLSKGNATEAHCIVKVGCSRVLPFMRLLP